MKFNRYDTALVVIDRQNDVLSEKGVSWGLVGDGIKESNMARSPLSAEEIRAHARLAERVAEIYYQRHGLWPKVRRFFGAYRCVS